MLRKKEFPIRRKNYRDVTHRGKKGNSRTIWWYSRTRDVAENPLQNYLTTKVTKKWRKEHKERVINE